MTVKQEKLLKQQVKDLPITDDLKKLFQFNKITTLQDVLNIEVYNWHKKFAGFTYHYQHEIVEYLKNNDLMEYLKED